MGALVLLALLAVKALANHEDQVSDLRRLTPETDYSSSPSLSSDGKWIVYATNRAEAGNVDIWIDSANGRGARRLTTNPAADLDPTISPDGLLVAFRSERQSRGIYTIGADGSHEQLLIPGGRSPIFSPDGRSVAYWIGDPDESAPSRELYVKSLADGGLRRIAPGFADARYPAWSPDGQFLMFEGCPAGPASFPACRDLWIARTEGSVLVQTGAMPLLESANIDLYPHQKAWRGHAIFVSGKVGTGIDALWELTIGKDMRVTGKPRQLTAGEAREHEPSFAVNGTLAFSRLSGALHTWRIAFDSSGAAHATKLTDTPIQDCCPAVSRDGRFLFFTRRIQIFRDIFRKDLGSGADSVLVVSQEEKSWPVPDAEGRKVAFESRHESESSIHLVAGEEPPRKLCTGCSHPTSWFGDSAIFHTSQIGGISLLGIETGISSTVLSAAKGVTLGEADWNPENQYLLFTSGAKGTTRRKAAITKMIAEAIDDEAPTDLTGSTHKIIVTITGEHPPKPDPIKKPKPRPKPTKKSTSALTSKK